MTFKLTTTLSLCLMALCACQTAPPTGALGPEYEISKNLVNATEVIAVVNTQVNAVDLEQQAAEWGYSLKKKEKLEGLDMYIMVFDCPPGIDPYDAVVELERLQSDSTVGVNHKYDLQSGLNVNETEFIVPSRGYADQLIDWPETGCEAQMPIGIIDGGISPALLRRNGDRIAYRPFINTPPSAVALEHGSAIASIFTEPSRLNQVQLYIAAVVSEDKKGQPFSSLVPMLKALNWMAENNVKVVNVSLAGPKNTTLEKAIRRAVDRGMIIVAAVGNDGENSSPRYPAAFDTVIATTAVNKDSQIYDQAVRGSHVDFAAPGVQIYVPDEGNGRFVSGTSFAAPFVTAIIASHSKNSEDLTTKEIETLLSRSTIDLGEKGKDPIYGMGLIKAKANCSF